MKHLNKVIKLSEHQSKLIDEYQKILAHWNKNINLVSRRLTPNQLSSHILDSIFLGELIDDKKAVVVDIGSGSGMPGIILAILGFSNCNLIEINNKKAVFLKTTALQLNLNANVIKADFASIPIQADYIVAKAFASITHIVDESEKLRHAKTQYFLIKSERQLDEVKELERFYNFSWKVYKSKYNDESIVIKLSDIKAINHKSGNK